MQVVIDAAGIRLGEPQDCARFSVVADDVPAAVAALGAAGAGGAVGDGVAVRIDAVRRWAGPLGDDPSWQADFEAMLGFAAKRDWITADGAAIVAHVESAGPA